LAGIRCIVYLSQQRKEYNIMKYVCTVCGYVYDEETGDPENGVAAGTKWEDVPEDYVCPLCQMGKEVFEAE
jgi:rubredoxin